MSTYIIDQRLLIYLWLQIILQIVSVGFSSALFLPPCAEIACVGDNPVCASNGVTYGECCIHISITFFAVFISDA